MDLLRRAPVSYPPENQTETFDLFRFLCSQDPCGTLHQEDWPGVEEVKGWLILHGVCQRDTAAWNLCMGCMDTDYTNDQLRHTARIVQCARRLEGTPEEENSRAEGEPANSSPQGTPRQASLSPSGSVRSTDSSTTGTRRPGGKLSAQHAAGTASGDSESTWSTIGLLTHLVLEHEAKFCSTDPALFAPEIAEVLPTQALDDAALEAEIQCLRLRVSELDTKLESEAPVKPGDYDPDAVERALRNLQREGKNLKEELHTFRQWTNEALAAVEVTEVDQGGSDQHTEPGKLREREQDPSLSVGERLGDAAERLRRLDLDLLALDRGARSIEDHSHEALQDQLDSTSVLRALEAALDKTAEKHAVLRRRARQLPVSAC